MSFNHPVSDLVTRIRNGYLAKKTLISTPASNLRENILQILKGEGYILNYSKVKEKGVAERFDIHLKYLSDKFFAVLLFHSYPRIYSWYLL